MIPYSKAVADTRRYRCVQLPRYEKYASRRRPNIQRPHPDDAQEMKILEDLGDGNYAVVFDGTPYRCECFGVGIRVIGPDGKVRNGGVFILLYAHAIGA